MKREKSSRMLLGVGFDGQDGHKRMTKGDNFVLMGGSEETHEQMTETVIRVNEKLTRRGKDLDTVSRDELNDLFHEAMDH